MKRKRACIMEIFFEMKGIFQLKGIEKISPKDKGMTAVSVLQSMVDDCMVVCEDQNTRQELDFPW